MKIRITARTNKIRSEVEDVIDIDDEDGLSSEEISEIAREVMMQGMIEWNWEQVSDDI